MESTQMKGVGGRVQGRNASGINRSYIRRAPWRRRLVALARRTVAVNDVDFTRKGMAGQILFTIGPCKRKVNTVTGKCWQAAFDGTGLLTGSVLDT